jgi:hypothetical protein
VVNKFFITFKRDRKNGATTLSFKTFSIIAFILKSSFAAINISDTLYRNHYAECHNLFKAMLSVVMLSVVILNVVAPKRHGQIDHATYDCV